MKNIILKILAKIEKLRNNLLWKIHEHFFNHDYDCLSLWECYTKYNDKLENIQYYEEHPERLKALELKREEEFKRRPVVLEGTDYIAHEFAILNVDTGEFIDNCVRANQTIGYYTFYKKNKRNKLRKFTQKANIAIVWKG